MAPTLPNRRRGRTVYASMRRTADPDELDSLGSNMYGDDVLEEELTPDPLAGAKSSYIDIQAWNKGLSSPTIHRKIADERRSEQDSTGYGRLRSAMSVRSMCLHSLARGRFKRSLPR